VKLLTSGSLLFLSVLLAGCGKSPIVGKWEADVKGAPADTAGSTTFTETEYITNFQMPLQDTLVKVEQRGTYKLEGNKIVMTNASSTFNESAFPASAKGFATKLKEGLDVQKGKAVTSDIAFEGSTMTLKTEGVEVTYKKVQ
jgi:hypothetical protein